MIALHAILTDAAGFINHILFFMAGPEGIEPSSADLEAAMLPLHQEPMKFGAALSPFLTSRFG